jgi:hypothetical protein
MALLPGADTASLMPSERIGKGCGKGRPACFSHEDKAAEFAGLGSSCLAKIVRWARDAAVKYGKAAAKKLVRPLLRVLRTYCGFSLASGDST